jgi:hypothetical protein
MLQFPTEVEVQRVSSLDTDQHKILKHVATRWLSLEKCIQCTLPVAGPPQLLREPSGQRDARKDQDGRDTDHEKAGKIKTVAT